MLVTNRAAIKTIRDFTEQDKIALPAIKVSSQAICLQMAAAKEWGEDQYARLDAYTITRPHPDAAVSVMSKATEINSHYSVAPYYTTNWRRRACTTSSNPMTRWAVLRPTA